MWRLHYGLVKKGLYSGTDQRTVPLLPIQYSNYIVVVVVGVGVVVVAVVEHTTNPFHLTFQKGHRQRSWYLEFP